MCIENVTVFAISDTGVSVKFIMKLPECQGSIRFRHGPCIN